MTEIAATHLDLLAQKKAFASLATVMSNGAPQVTPVWFDYTGGVIRVNTARGRVKARTLKEGATVAMSIMDPDNPYRYIQIRGVVKRVTEQGASDHINALTRKYLGQDQYPYAQPGEVRLMVEIAPVAAQALG